jgi:hypothetical protein
MPELAAFSSHVFSRLYIYYKFVVTLLKLPAYIFKNYDYLLTRWGAFVRNTINLEKEYQTHVEMISLLTLQKILSGGDPHIFFKLGSRYGNISMMESIAIAYMVSTLKPRRIFEIGTFDGFSTFHLAMNSPDDSEIYTLNLPVYGEIQKHSLLDYYDDYLTHAVLSDREIGAFYKNCSESKKVRQLFGNSLMFNYDDYKGKIDLCFIDGGHSFQCVAEDTENALKMLSDKGVIIWHDFNIQHRDVYDFLMKFSLKHKILWIKDTRLAIYFNDIKDT